MVVCVWLICYTQVHYSGPTDATGITVQQLLAVVSASSCH